MLWTNEAVSRESKSEEKIYEVKAVNVTATAFVSENDQSVSVGRKAGPTTATPIGESLRMVTKQLLRAPPATDMVATDIRTPPKIKNKIVEEFVPLGKGEAIPVILEDSDSYDVVSNTQFVKAATADPTKASGISTWILLNGSEQSTQATQKKQQVKPIPSPTTQTSITQTKKKPVKVAENLTPNISENIKKTNNSTSQKTDIKSTTSNTKPTDPAKKTQTSTGKDELLTKVPAALFQDAKFKNKTPVIVGKIPSSGNRNKTDTWNVKKKVTATIIPVSNTETAPSTTPTPIKRKPSPTQPTSTATTTTATATSKPAPVYHYELVPTTSVILQSDIVDADTTEELVTTEEPTTTTRRTRRPGTKKKKKNKNRRRRPAKKPEGVLESKITEDNVTKILPTGARPLSTRIYNYLAREVMPSVGVGIVGLVLTAGLAGLFLYPFGGGVVARRRYDKVSGPSPDGHMYYYNDYSSKGEVDNGQPEESIFGQVLAGMTQSETKFGQYDSRPSSQYSQPSKYRYDHSHDHTYASNGYKSYNKDKYPEVGSVSKHSSRNPDTYSTLTESSGPSSKYTTSVGATGNSQYTDTKYSSSVGTTGISQYTDSKYSSPVGTTGNSQYADTKYSSPVVTTGNSKYTDKKYSSPVLATGSSSDSSNKRYSTLTGVSIEPQNNKYSSLTSSSSQNSDYQPVGEYTAYNNPSDVGTHGGIYKSSSGDVPKYSDIEYDDSKDSSALIEEDKSNKNQPTFAALHSSPYQSSYSKMDSMIPITGTYNKEVRHRQGVVAIEHGPRNLKIERKRRDTDDNLSNEVDGVLSQNDLNKMQTTTDANTGETTTDIISTTAVSPTTIDNNAKSENLSDQNETITDEPVSTTIKPYDEDNTFMGFLRRLAQIKLRLGLDLLKSTTQAVARYFNSVQMKMESAVKALENRGSSMHSMHRRMKKSIDHNNKTK